MKTKLAHSDVHGVFLGKWEVLTNVTFHVPTNVGTKMTSVIKNIHFGHSYELVLEQEV